MLAHTQGLSSYKIAKALSLSRGAVRHWVDEWKSGGDMEEKHKSGRPRVLSTRAKYVARKRLKQPGFGGLARAARTLQAKGYTRTPVHVSTLSRMLKERAMRLPAPLVAVRSKPRRALTDYDKQRRRTFAAANLSTPWDNVMFTDRKRFYFRYPGSKVRSVQWQERGQKRQAITAGRPLCVNVYMGITKFGSTGPTFITGTSKHHTTYTTKAGKPARNITTSEYTSVLNDHLLPAGNELMSKHGHRSWVFQQHNDPAHKAAWHTIMKYNRRHTTSIRLLPGWPPHSPDLNLIENVWGTVQQQLDASGCKTFLKFQSKLRCLLSCVPQQWLVKAYMGMPQRVEDIVRLEGGKTNH